MGRIIVLGSINMDVVAQTPRHPRPGETLLGSNVRFVPGGKGANQAVAASRLGHRVTLVGKLGQDSTGIALRAFLQGENLDLDHLTFSPTAPSGTAIITVADDAENIIIVVSGSNFEVSPADIDRLNIAPDDLVVSVFEVPQSAIHAAFAKAKAVGARTLLNPAPAADFAPGLRDLCDYLIVNETELAHFAGEAPDPNDHATLRRQMYAIRSRAEQVIIVTLGAQGAVCLRGDDFFAVPGRPVKPVDTTAAGDCFVGALAVALLEGKPLADAIAFANAAASLSVQKFGASSSLPDRPAVDATLNESKS